MTTRRDLMTAATALASTTFGTTALSPAQAAARGEAPFKADFKADWESLGAGYQTPDWFKDAKLGLWSHWGPQCVPEAGDWYGRQMYIQGNPYYDIHVAKYGHPAHHGFMDIIGQWKVTEWDAEGQMALYKAAGAKYFVSMANHHDNMDMFDSKFHKWNSVNVGPKMDIVGRWEKVARAAGMRFGVSNHAAHAWHWWQTAYGYDAEGPMRGVRYDAATLKKEDGKGTWWEGLDPQDLYTGRWGDMVPPDGLTTIKAMQDYHDQHSGQWLETSPHAWYAKQWLLRQNDLIDKYRPDFVYFDNYGLPLEQAGLDATAYFYNQNRKWHGGKLEAVVTGKKLDAKQKRAIVDDVERGFSDSLRAEYWQTCTCIGNWHYDRGLYDRNGYKSAKDVIQRLADVVSKNGNMLLSIPQRGNGAIDEKEVKILQDMAAWMAINGEAIFGTRHWAVYGEGPARFTEGMQNEGDQKGFTHEDIRYTTRGDVLYALGQDWPHSGYMSLTALAEGTGLRKGTIERVELLGHGQPLDFGLSVNGLNVKLPDARPGFTPVLKIMGSGLV